MLFVALIAGVAILATGNAPNSVNNLASHDSTRYIWASALVAGPLLAITGIFIRPWWGIQLEQIGLSLVGAASIYYAVAVFTFSGFSALIAGGYSLGFGVACYVQVWKIRKLVRHAIKEQR